jgi:hypothetical protein
MGYSVRNVESYWGQFVLWKFTAIGVMVGLKDKESYGANAVYKHFLKASICGSSFINISNNRYFKVIVEETILPPIEMLIESGLMEARQWDRDYQREMNHIMDTATFVDKSPWIRRAGWNEVFVGRDMEVLIKALEPPNSNDNLRMVWDQVESVLRHCGNGVKDCKKRNWTNIGFWLNSIDAHSPSTVPFPVFWSDGMFERYVGYWQRFVCFCIHAISEEDEFGVEFTEVQKMLLTWMLSVIEMEKVEESMLRTLEEWILEFSTLCIMHSDFERTKSVLQYFCGILGWDSNMKV